MAAVVVTEVVEGTAGVDYREVVVVAREVKVVKEVVVEAREVREVVVAAQAADKAEEAAAANPGWAAEVSAGSWTKRMTAPARKICAHGADQVVRAPGVDPDPVVADVFRVADEAVKVARADKEEAREVEVDKAARVDRVREAVEDKAVREDRVAKEDSKDHRCLCADQPKMKSTLA